MDLKNNRPNYKPKLVSLKRTGELVKDVWEFKKNIIANLGDEIFNYQTKQILLFHLLKQITPINKSVVLNDKSIETACECIVKHFGLDLDAKVSVSTDRGWKEIKGEKKNNTEIFCEHIIGIDKVPGKIYEQLLKEVTQDLSTICELINWYEQQGCIQRFLAKNEIPKAHNERTVYDFYKRCIAERGYILNYQLFGLKKRALVKAQYTPKWIAGMLAWSEIYRDRPYYFARPFSIHYFDCRQIDLAGHRIGEYPLSEGEKMQKLYFTNKASFYRSYFKRVSVDQHFQNFSYYLAYIPLQNNRKPIFEELVKLFKAKRWISFYALALPQVEGLFSEMCLVISPEMDLSQRSLAHKVNSVRPYHVLSASYFDYYQYHIPLQRNKFSHTGYDEDFKLKSYDLLVDLSHLFKIFYELDNPFVKIRKLHTRRNFEDFITISEIADYFNQLNNLKASQMNKIRDNIGKFEKEFLSQDCSIEYTCYEMIQDLPEKLKEIIESINDFDFDVKKITGFQITKMLQDNEKREKLQDWFNLKKDLLELLEDHLIFLTNYNRYLPSLAKEAKSELVKFNNEYGNSLQSIVNLYSHLKKQSNNPTVELKA